MVLNELIWIGATEGSVSETFIRDNLDVCKKISTVSGFSGATVTSLAADYNIVASGFMMPKESFAEKAIRKLINYPLYYTRTNLRFKKQHFKEIQRKRHVILFVEFGFTAVMIHGALLELSKPFVIQVHGVDVSAMFELEGYKQKFLDVAKAASAVICPSEHIKRLCVLAGVDEKKCAVIFNSRDPKKIQAARTTKKTTYPSFVQLGRLTQKKNPFATLEAFKIVHRHIDDARLTFIGDGELMGELRRRISNYGLDAKVSLPGAMSHQDALRLMSSHWIYCQHSVTSRKGDSEGMPTSIAEASLLGLPVVSTTHNGIPEEVEHEISGYLTKEFDYHEMAKYMGVLASDESLRVRMGEQGKLKSQEMGCPELRCSKLKELLNKIMDV